MGTHAWMKYFPAFFVGWYYHSENHLDYQLVIYQHKNFTLALRNQSQPEPAFEKKKRAFMMSASEVLFHLSAGGTCFDFNVYRNEQTESFEN